MPALKTLYGDQNSSYLLPKGVTRIGRSLDSEIQIPLKVVSKFHAVITYDGIISLIQNLSANQTYLNGDRVTESVKLKHGDQIRIATVTMMYVDRDADESSGLLNGQDLVRILSPSDAAGSEQSLTRLPVPLAEQSRRITISRVCDISEEKIRASIRLTEQSITSLLSKESAKAFSQTLKLVKVLEHPRDKRVGDHFAEQLRQCFPVSDEVVILACEPSESNELAVWGMSESNGRAPVVCSDVVHRVSTQLECLLINDLWRATNAPAPGLSNLGYISLLCVPIVSANGSIRGVVHVLAQKPTPDFEAEDLARLAFLAQLLTMVVG
jgi:hypothetical protein